MKKLFIIKIGGALIDKEEELDSFLEMFAAIKTPKILVHGGGKLADTLAKKLSVPQKMMDGRRVTNEETLDIATMVYAGKINKNIVAKLQNLNCNTIGFSGADANLIQAKKREVLDVDYGFVGDVKRKSVDAKMLRNFLKLDLVPVFSAITYGRNAELLNTNADSIAGVLAQALSKKYDVELLYCFDKDGVLEDVDNPESVVQFLDASKYESLKESGKLHKGILPKLKNAFDAIENKVNNVFLINETKLKQHITNDNQGTQICL